MKFAEAIMDKPMSYYAFEMLYWCGIREGEMLALTPADFNFTKKTVRINKTYAKCDTFALLATIPALSFPGGQCKHCGCYVRKQSLSGDMLNDLSQFTPVLKVEKYPIKL